MPFLARRSAALTRWIGEICVDTNRNTHIFFVQPFKRPHPAIGILFSLSLVLLRLSPVVREKATREFMQSYTALKGVCRMGPYDLLINIHHDRKFRRQIAQLFSQRSLPDPWSLGSYSITLYPPPPLFDP